MKTLNQLLTLTAFAALNIACGASTQQSEASVFASPPLIVDVSSAPAQGEAAPVAAEAPSAPDFSPKTPVSTTQARSRTTETLCPSGAAVTFGSCPEIQIQRRPEIFKPPVQDPFPVGNPFANPNSGF